MKRIFSLFFLVIMTLNVAIPFVEQLRGDLYEIAKVITDDESRDGKEKETEKGKESLVFLNYSAIKFAVPSLEKFKKSLFPTNDHPISEPYTSLPELPPEV